MRAGTVFFLAVAMGALLLPSTAGSATYATVLSPSGAVAASGAGASFSYPADGTAVQLSGVEALPGDVQIQDIELLGGAVELMHVDLLGDGTVLIGSLIAGGHVISPVTPNMLIPLGTAGYAVVDQTAKLGGHTGRVAVRLVVEDAPGVPRNTQVLVGLAQDPATQPAAERHASLAVLGFSAAVSASVGFAAAPSMTSGPIGERAVAIAEQFLGTPYTWGGASPLTGFDCSGLAMYVYAQLGITLTHYTGAQLLQGMPVARTDLAPGDLVFFEPDASGVPQHEGIYVGDGKFVEAPHTGDVVKISTLDDPRAGLTFVGAVRPYVR